MKKASDFYLQLKTNNDLKSYNSKYFKGKNIIDSYLEDKLLNEIVHPLILNKDPKCLEIGVFSGRINKKLKSLFSDIDVTEHNMDMLIDWENGFLFDWVNNKIDNNLRQKDSYDFIISLGHQLSFSCEVEKGLKEITDLLNHKGYLVFDCWNEKTNISFDPEFKLEKINTDQLQKILYDLKLEVVFIGYGQKIFYFTPKLWLIIHRIIGRFLYPIVRFLENALWENKILARNAQNIYCVARG